MTRTYLDNAATSWPKPETVYRAVERYLRENGAAVGRGATARGLELQRTVDRCRERAARLLGAESARHVVFTGNGTDALNLALHGLLRPGDHVVTTDVEHNSVLRPLEHLQRNRGINTTFVTPGTEGVVTVDDVRRAMLPETRLVVVSHVSNVTGAIQPIEEIISAAQDCGAMTLIDAAQSAGHLPLHVSTLGADLLACSGHKGLLGPLGTGLLILRPGVEDQLESLRQGGTGTHSEEPSQPATLPDKLESGNHNAPGIVGLEAALAWIEDRGIAALREHDRKMMARLHEGLRRIPGVTRFGPDDAHRCSGVISFVIDDLPPQDVATILDEHFSIECRAGLHCAPRMHRALGTLEAGGTVRFSPGPFTTESEIDAAIEAVRQIAGA